MAYNAYASIDPSKIDPAKVVQLGPTGGERFSLYGSIDPWLTQKGAVGKWECRPKALPAGLSLLPPNVIAAALQKGSGRAF